MSNFNLLRKKSIAAGAVAVVVVAVGCFGALNMLDVKSTHSSFQKSGKTESTVQVGNLELTLTQLKGVDVAVIGDDTTFTATGVTVDESASSKTTPTDDEECKISYSAGFDNIYPGWKGAYGFEVKNSGSLEAYINLYLGSIATALETEQDWDGVDPRKRINMEVYSSDSPDGEYTQIFSGKLDGDSNVTGTFEKPGKLKGTNDSLQKGDKTYYIVKFEFTNTEENDVFSGNNGGDNVYENSGFKVNLSVNTSGPLADNFKYE